MKNNKYSSLLTVIFCFGLFVTVAALFLIEGLFDGRTGTYIFTCANVILIYIAAFFPFLTSFVSGDTAKVVISGTVYYKGMWLYGVISAANIYLAIKVLPLAVSVAIQLVVLFIFAIYIFMAKATSDTISSVEENENIQKSLITEMRNKAYQLLLMTDSSDDPKVRDAVKKINDDLRYLSPSSSPEAYDLECRMSTLIDSMASDVYFKFDGAKSTETLEMKFGDYDFYYNQRKNIY